MKKRKRTWNDDDYFEAPVESAPLPSLDIMEADAVGFGGMSLPVVRNEDGTVQFGDRFTVSHTGVVIADYVTEKEMWAFFEGIKKVVSGIQWIIGDIFFCAENRFNLTYEKIAEKTGYSVRTVEQYIYVIRNVSMRIEKLSFYHHQIVAHLTHREQKTWLDDALKNGWSARELSRQIKGETIPATVSILADKTNRNRMNRIWRAVQSGNFDKLKREDVDASIAWLKEVRGKL